MHLQYMVIGWEVASKAHPLSLPPATMFPRTQVVCVHGRTVCLLGLVEKTEQGRIHVPFEVIEADFELRAA
jgi:hypothetical protein